MTAFDAAEIVFEPEPPKMTSLAPLTVITLFPAFVGSMVCAVRIWPDAWNVALPSAPMIVLFEPPIVILFDPEPPMMVLPPEPPLIVLFPPFVGKIDLMVVSKPLVKVASPFAPITTSAPRAPSVIVFEPEPPMTTLLPLPIEIVLPKASVGSDEAI